MKPTRSDAEDWLLAYPIGSYVFFHLSRRFPSLYCQVSAYCSSHGWPYLVLEIILSSHRWSSSDLIACRYSQRADLQPVVPQSSPKANLL